MSNASTQFKESLQRELAALASARDELKLQMHLAKAEAKDEWHKLEDNFSRLEEELKRTSSGIEAPLRELGSAARGMLDELKQGYERLRSSLKS